jgi:hypothetical protein
MRPLAVSPFDLGRSHGRDERTAGMADGQPQEIDDGRGTISLPPSTSQESLGFVSRVTLVGGPLDDATVDGEERHGCIEAGGARYVLRRAYPLDSDQPNGWVGVHLPLYAALMASRYGE